MAKKVIGKKIGKMVEAGEDKPKRKRKTSAEKRVEMLKEENDKVAGRKGRVTITVEHDDE